MTHPTTIAVGPDGRLYVGDDSGRVVALTLDANTKQVTAVQTIATSAQLQEVYGIAFDPTDASSPPPIYVTNTISGFGEGFVQAPPSGQPGAYAGKITKISGAAYATRADIITGLPVANSGHEANGLAFGPDGRLYIAQGGNDERRCDRPGGSIFQREETTPRRRDAGRRHQGRRLQRQHHLQRRRYLQHDDERQPAANVSVYAAGLRNPYDLVFHSNGRLYNTDNGPNDGYGPGSTACSPPTRHRRRRLDDRRDSTSSSRARYYGHPNRNRGRTDARQCTYHANGTAQQRRLHGGHDR